MGDQTSEQRICPLLHPSHPDEPSKCRLPALICYGHIRKLRGNLADLPVLHDLLSDAHIRWEQVIGFQSPSADEPIPIDEAISEHRSLMMERVGSWVRIVAKARSVSTPAPENGPLTPDPRMLQAFCSWLLVHVDWITSHAEYAQDFAEAMAEITGRAWSLRYPNRLQEIELDDCINIVDGARCSGRTFAMMRPKDELFPKYIACNTCDATVDSKGWYRYGLEVIAHQEAAA